MIISRLGKSEMVVSLLVSSSVLTSIVIISRFVQKESVASLLVPIYAHILWFHVFSSVFLLLLAAGGGLAHLVMTLSRDIYIVLLKWLYYVFPN